MDRCPICDVAVKPENLLRHLNDIHPRHPDTPALREELQQEPGRIPKRSAGRPIHIRRWHVIVVVALVLGGLGVYYAADVLTVARPFPCVTTAESQLPMHWHTQLSISSGAASVEIPANIGISFSCMEPLHTHDTTGKIHIESEQFHLYSIGDFFRVWNRPWGNPTIMHVNGTAMSPNAAQILWDGEDLHIQY
jgi:hypothetical protein